MDPTLSEYYSDALPVPSSLWAMFDESTKKNADKPAITVMHQPSDHLARLKHPSSQPSNKSCLEWTFADLRHACLALASGFHNQGVRRGMTVVTLIPNCVECALLLWVSAILQLRFAPLDSKLLDAGREEQLRDYMRRLQPDIVVLPNGDGVEVIEGTLKAVHVKPVLRLSLTASDDIQGWKALDSIVPADGAEPEASSAALGQDPALDDDGYRVAIILFTSGTSSGKPKGCPRTVRNLLSCTVGEFAFPTTPSRIMIHTPNSGTICQAFLLMCANTGRHAIMPAPAFSPPAALDAIEHLGAEYMAAIPVMSRMFEKELSGKTRDVSALRQVLVGGDIVTTDAVARFGALFPNAQIVVAHGMTEGHSFIGWRDRGVPASVPEYRSILGSGTPAPGSLVRVCDSDGKILPRGEAGELHLGGPCVIERYLEDAQPEAFYNDEKGHWMLTGDRAFMDEDGVVFIVGRNKDVIKKMGLSLSPAVVESVLNRMDGVEASVFGIPHPDFGEIPVAIVKSPKHAADSTEIQKAVTDSLGTDYALEDVKSLEDIGLKAWPLNQTGKINKHELKSAYMSKFGP